MKNLILKILFLTILVFSCRSRPEQDDIQIIRIEIGDKKIEKPEVSFELIPLDTSNKSMIGYIGMVRYFNGRFYILNNNRFEKPALYAFGRNGKFIRKTALGRGPGEVIEPYAFTINKQDSVIVLHDQASKPTYIFDPDLNFIKEIPHEYRFITDLYHINKDTFLVYHDVPKKDADGKMLKEYYTNTIYTDDFRNEKHIELLSGLSNNISMQAPVSILNNEVLFMVPFNNKIYKLVKSDARVKYIIDFGKLNFSADELKTKSIEEVFDLTRSGSRVMPVGFCRTDDYLAVISLFKDSLYTHIYSNNTGKIYSLNECIKSVMVPGFNIWGNIESGEILGIVTPQELIQFRKSGGNTGNINVTEFDNPYIILVKIKLP